MQEHNHWETGKEDKAKKLESEDLPLHEDFTPAGHGMESRMSVALFARFPHSVDFSGPGVAMSPRSVCFAAIFRTGGNIQFIK